jgi:hypothetical protein
VKVSELFPTPEPPCLREALRLLKDNLWPIPLYGIDDARATTPGKQPIGLEWGVTKHTKESLREIWSRYPDANVGLKLGKDTGIADIEVEDRKTGEASFLTLMGGEVVTTMGWTSARGNHRLFQWDQRMARYDKSIIKHAELPGLEIRFGALTNEGKQFQSACPPSIGDDGQKRRWNGVRLIAPLPDAAYELLDRLMAAPKPRVTIPIADIDRGPARTKYAMAAMDREIAALNATAEGGRNDRLNLAAFNLGQLVAADLLNQSDVESVLMDAALSIGLGEGESRKTVDSGMGDGMNHPRDLTEVGQRNGFAVSAPRPKSKPKPIPEVELTGEEDNTGWPPLRLGKMPEVLEFPIGVFPEPVACIVKEVSRAVGCDPGMVAGAVLGVTGGLIGRSVSLLRGQNWFLKPTVFLANIGLPGDGKSPSLEYIMNPIDLIDGELAGKFIVEKVDYTNLMEDYLIAQRAKDPTVPKPIAPVPVRVHILDTTFEKLLKVLAANPRGLFMGLDELTILLTSLNQYKGGSGSDRSHLLAIWGGKSILVDRVRDELGEPMRIPHPCLSIVGNLVPGMLSLLSHSKGDDGMIDRWLYCFPGRKPKLRSDQRNPVSRLAIEGWVAVARTLWTRPMVVHEEHLVPYTLRFSESGQTAFDEEYDHHVEEMNGSDFPDELLGPWSKLEEYAGRFCLILACLHHAASEVNPTGDIPLVDPAIVSSAWRLVDYFKSHHRKVRAYLQGGNVGGMPEGARLIVNWIRANPDAETFHQRDLTRNYHRFRDRAFLEDSLDWLMRKNAILPVREENNPSRTGRPRSRAWAVHPEFHIQDGPRKPQNRETDNPAYANAVQDTPGPGLGHA